MSLPRADKPISDLQGKWLRCFITQLCTHHSLNAPRKGKIDPTDKQWSQHFQTVDTKRKITPTVMIIQPRNDILQFPSLKSPCSKQLTPTLKNSAQLGPNSYQIRPKGDSTLQQKKLGQSRSKKHLDSKKSPLQSVFRPSLSLNSPSKEMFPQGIKVRSETCPLTHEMCPELRENRSAREIVVLPRLSTLFSLVE